MSSLHSAIGLTRAGMQVDLFEAAVWTVYLFAESHSHNTVAEI